MNVLINYPYEKNGQELLAVKKFWFWRRKLVGQGDIVDPKDKVISVHQEWAIFNKNGDKVEEGYQHWAMCISP